MDEKAQRSGYRSRQNIRRVAQEIVSELTSRWPGTSVTVDLDGVDGEDAFLWISPTDVDNRDDVALTALELVNSLGARMGFWIVPRVLHQAVDSGETSHRLRLVHRDEHGLNLGGRPGGFGSTRNVLQRS